MTDTDPPRDRARDEQVRTMLVDELETAWLYDRLAALSREPETVTTLQDLAEAERRHARHWAERLGDTSLLETEIRPALRVRLLALLARLAGVAAVLPRLRTAELADIRRYESDPDPQAAALAQEEREHRAVLGRLDVGGRLPEAEHGFASTSAASTFRATLFGLNDGIVSNLSLVAGVAGAAVESDAVLIAGIAGLLAGAFSMGAGEYVSMRSQREFFENQIAKERLELELDPAEEHAELIAIYRRKGVSPDLAESLVDELMRDPESALDTLVKEELGLNPNDLGSPWAAAVSSFLAFALGAFVPVLPFIIGGGYSALVAAVIAGAVVLGLAGAFTSLLTGRHPLYAGTRMVLIGLAATGVTFAIGSVIPVDL